MAEHEISGVLLVDPTGEAPDSHSLNLAPRPTDLRGKRLGLLDNSKANSDVILHMIANILNEQYEFSEIFYTQKHSASLPPKPEVLADLHRNADIIIAGVGD
jgi:hypothetical protein|tara:strand:- start:430 stop:735 length:306 start_codon:yes stop_codon:yes gene_type:complete